MVFCSHFILLVSYEWEKHLTGFSSPLDWYRGHRLRRKSKKVSAQQTKNIHTLISLTERLLFTASVFQLVNLYPMCAIMSLFLLQGIFPACYIHLKEATVEGSGLVLLRFSLDQEELLLLLLHLCVRLFYCNHVAGFILQAENRNRN